MMLGSMIIYAIYMKIFNFVYSWSKENIPSSIYNNVVSHMENDFNNTLHYTVSLVFFFFFFFFVTIYFF